MICDPRQLPLLLTVEQLAEIEQVSVKAIYHRIARGQIPGVTRRGRWVRIIRDTYLRSLREEKAAT